MPFDNLRQLEDYFQEQIEKLKTDFYGHAHADAHAHDEPESDVDEETQTAFLTRQVADLQAYVHSHGDRDLDQPAAEMPIGDSNSHADQPATEMPIGDSNA